MNNLSEEQDKIVNHDFGNVVVVAGAGSGKTLCLTERAACLLEKGATERSILMFTFTKKAAAEISARLEQKVGKTAISTSTIHSLALRIFRKHSKLLGYDQLPTIWTPERSSRLAAQQLKGFFNLQGNERKNAVNQWGDPLLIPDEPSLSKEDLNRVLKKFPPIPPKISGVEPKEYHAAVIAHFGNDFQLYATVATTVLANKSACNVITFDDMIPAALRLLRDHRGEVDDDGLFIFSHVMVDEYQDVNDLNVDFIRELSVHAESLMVVGDDDQAIYGFRGGNTEHILKFPERFDAQVFYLTTNYRCQPGIVSIANELISHNKDRYHKQMHPSPSKAASSSDVQMIHPFRGVDGAVVNESRRDVHAEIWQHIQGLVHFVGLEPKDIAILARNNYNLNIMQKRMRYHNSKIPVQRRVEDRVPFQLASLAHLYKDPFIQRIHNWFSLLLNEGDLVNVRETLLDAIDGFGEKSALSLMDYMHKNPAEDLPAQVRGLHGYPRHGLKTVLGKRIEIMAASLERLLLEAPKDSLSDILDKVLVTGCITSQLLSMQGKSFKMQSKADNHFNRIDEYTALLKAFPTPKRGLEAIADWMDDVSTEIEAVERDGINAVQLVTIHSAKGKEWPVVFVADLEKGILPSPRNLEEEEERRLLYVAMTRAEQTLYLCYAKSDDEGTKTGRSPFLEDLDLSSYTHSEAL
jgi:DNA helicase-2/ATP-dependent DNA helicase PcrA